MDNQRKQCEVAVGKNLIQANNRNWASRSRMEMQLMLLRQIYVPQSMMGSLLSRHVNASRKCGLVPPPWTHIDPVSSGICLPAQWERQAPTCLISKLIQFTLFILSQLVTRHIRLMELLIVYIWSRGPTYTDVARCSSTEHTV